MELLGFFILMQSSVPLNQIDVIKEKFNGYERKLTKWFKGRIIFFAIIKLTVIFVGIIPRFVSDFTVITLIESLTMLIFLVMMMHEYVSVVLITFRLMWNLHRFEFKEHAFRMIGLSLANMLALCYAIIGFYGVSVTSLCLQIN